MEEKLTMAQSMERWCYFFLCCDFLWQCGSLGASHVSPMAWDATPVNELLGALMG
jgi:hypothetical protein